MLNPDVVAQRFPGLLAGVGALEAVYPFYVLQEDELGPVAAPDQLVDRVPGQGLDRLGREHDGPVPIEDDDRVGCVRQQSSEPVFARRERRGRDFAVARAHPHDPHDEQQAGGHQHGDAVAAPGAQDARRPTESDRGLGSREAHQAPQGRGEHGG